MATLAEAEARINEADIQMRKRLRMGLSIPPRWHEVYAEAWAELVSAYERAHPDETRRYMATPTARRMRPQERRGARQAMMPISQGVR